jgi:AbrB family looped-hinge helix DNA binding protein
MGYTNVPSVSKDTRLGEKGQVVIPAEMREIMGLKPGDALIVRLEGKSVRITTRHALIEELEGAFATPGRDLTSELLEDRRNEANTKW